MSFSRRQLITAAAYGDADRWPTQKELADRFGVTQSAISQRISGFERKLTAKQLAEYRRRTRSGYRQALSKSGKPLPRFKTIHVRFGSAKGGQ